MSDSADPEREILCYNKGCGKTFKESENSPQSCTFHPGEPFFHDAYKGWSCCKRKCIDFTEFLNMKGCATSFHSNIKPLVASSESKPEETNESESGKGAKDDVNVPVRPPIVSMDRPDPNTPMVDIVQELAPNLKKFVAEHSNSKPLVDMECQNSGCKTKQSEQEANPICKYHPGQAIFHEGLKYWSCCNKKAMDFDQFMKQIGCKEGEHCWIPKAPSVDCRIDWHQTSTHVIVTIYCKGYDYAGVKVQGNGVKLRVELRLPNGKYEKEWILAGIIDEKSSIAILQTTKIEIKMKKAEPVQWSKLELDPRLKSSNDSNDNQNQGDGDGNVKSTGVEPIDLGDL